MARAPTTTDGVIAMTLLTVLVGALTIAIMFGLHALGIYPSDFVCTGIRTPYSYLVCPDEEEDPGPIRDTLSQD